MGHWGSVHDRVPVRPPTNAHACPSLVPSFPTELVHEGRLHRIAGDAAVAADTPHTAGAGKMCLNVQAGMPPGRDLALAGDRLTAPSGACSHPHTATHALRSFLLGARESPVSMIPQSQRFANEGVYGGAWRPCLLVTALSLARRVRDPRHRAQARRAAKASRS